MTKKSKKTMIIKRKTDKYFDADGVLLSTTVTDYDERGNIVKVSDDHENSQISEWTYDDNGVESVITKIYINGFLASKIFSKYKDDVITDSETTTYTIINGKPYVDKRTTIEYGFCMGIRYKKKSIIESGGESFPIIADDPTEERTIKYRDKNNLVTRAELYDNIGRIIKIEDYPGNVIYVYNYHDNHSEKLNAKLRLELIGDGILGVELFEYDDKDRVTKLTGTSTADNCSLKFSSIFEYDSNDNIDNVVHTSISQSDIYTDAKENKWRDKYYYNEHNDAVLVTKSDTNNRHEFSYIYY